MKNIQLKSFSWTAIAVAAALAISGCGNQQDIDLAKKKIVSGVITGFGKLKAQANGLASTSSATSLPASIVINGVEYQTNNATIDVDGKQTDADALKAGMYVTVEATVDSSGKTGVADSVNYDAEIVGKVTANNIATDKTMTVLGQVVHVDAATVVDADDNQAVDAASIVVGSVIEVSGYKDGAGDVYATRIEVKHLTADEADDEVEGVIASIDTSAKTFVVGTLTVDYSAADIKRGTAADLAVGVYVDVSSKTGLDASQRLVASKIKLENRGLATAEAHRDDNADHSLESHELEGRITASLTNGVLEVNGQQITVPANVRIEHGNASALVNGAKVEVEMTKDADGKLVAVSIEVKVESNASVTTVVSKDATGMTIEVDGKTVRLTNTTLFADDVEVGDHVDVKLHQNSDGSLVAVKVEIHPDTVTAHEVQGLVSEITADGKFVVLGITIDTSAVAGFTAAVGDQIEVKGSLVDNVFVATVAKIETESNGSEDDVNGGSTAQNGSSEDHSADNMQELAHSSHR